MTALGEEAFRALLDARGLLRPDALAAPDPSVAFTVFSQRPDAGLDIDTIKAHARRFFGGHLGLTVAKRYGTAAPRTDVARVVVAMDDGSANGTRLCFGRPATGADQAAAEAAEAAQNTNGMALLAQRCRTVWLVSLETDDDRVALTIAAILASTFLGPILSPAGDDLFGVRTARRKLEARARPYR